MLTAHRPHGAHVFLALAGLLIGFGMGAGWVTFAEEAADRSATSTAAKRSSTSAKSTGRDSQVEHKLDQLLAGQQTILKQFDAVLEELRIVKIRCSLQ